MASTFTPEERGKAEYNISLLLKAAGIQPAKEAGRSALSLNHEQVTIDDFRVYDNKEQWIGMEYEIRMRGMEDLYEPPHATNPHPWKTKKWDFTYRATRKLGETGIALGGIEEERDASVRLILKDPEAAIRAACSLSQEKVGALEAELTEYNIPLPPASKRPLVGGVKPVGIAPGSPGLDKNGRTHGVA